MRGIMAYCRKPFRRF